jgi:hypothetical protein
MNPAQPADIGAALLERDPLMRRLLPILLVLVAACGDSGAVTPAAPTATVAETTTTTPPTTTTTVAQDPEPIEQTTDSFEPIPGSPPAVFDSFTSTAEIVMGFGEVEISVAGSGAWTPDAFECSMTVGVGGFGAQQTVIVTPEQLWLDTGAGFEEAGLLGTAQEILSTCPASPLFWGDWDSGDFGRAVGETEDFYGRDAIRVDLAELTDLAAGMGAFADLGNAEIDTLVMWVDAATSVPLGYLAEVELDPAAVADSGLSAGDLPETVSMTMDLHIEQINDPAISIDLPTA